MNRTTVVFLALAIHQTPSGDFAPPYERAHVAFELGRGAVQGIPAAVDGARPISWSEAYPSAPLLFVHAEDKWNNHFFFLTPGGGGESCDHHSQWAA